jgi:hypothetical protein
MNSVLPSIETDICSSTSQSAIISNEFENEAMIMHNNDDYQTVFLLNNNFVNSNPIDNNNNTLLSDQLKIQNFANDLMINSLNKMNEENGSTKNIYDDVFKDDKNIASFANSCDKYLLVEVAINTGTEKMHEDNVSLLRKASLKYLAIKISEKMNETNLDTESFDLTKYFSTLCKTMSNVFKHIIDAGCKRLEVCNSQIKNRRNRLIANKNAMILRLKNLAVDIEETVSRTLNKLKSEHYNKKNFYLNAMQNVIKEHSKRFKQSKYENDKNAIDSEFSFVTKIVNNYCDYYDIKKNIIITASSSSSSDKKRKNNKSEENTDDEIEQKKEKEKKKSEESQEKIKKKKKDPVEEEMARKKAAEEKEDEKQKKEMARKKSVEEKDEEKQKKEMARKKAAEEKEQEKQKKEMARKKAAEDKEEEKEKKEKERKDAEEEKERMKFGEHEESDEEEQVKIDNKETDKSKQEEKINEKAGEEHDEMDVEVNNDLKIFEITINELLKTIKSEDGLILVTQFKMLYMNLLHKS